MHTMEDLDLKETEDGTYLMQRRDHRLHVGTGEEADQQWPDIQEDETAMPLLDLAEAWAKVVAEEELPSVIKKNEDIDNPLLNYNAQVIVAELKYHLLASTVKANSDSNPESASETEQEQQKEQQQEQGQEVKQQKEGQEGEQGHNPAPGSSENEEEKTLKQQPTEQDKSDQDPNHPKSVYGASILLKLQWEDRKPQKKVPHRTYEQLGDFIHDILDNVRQALQQNETAAKVVLNVLAFDLVPLLLARYMDGMETCTENLETNALDLLNLCAEWGSPKEMHLAIKTYIRMIDIVYSEATSYLMLKPLVTLWMRLILRMPKMRHSFLRDLLKEFDRMLSLAESYEASFVPNSGGIGIEKSGRIKGVNEMMLQFLEDVTRLQMKQHEQNDTISLVVDQLGRALKFVSLAQTESKRENKETPDTGNTTVNRHTKPDISQSDINLKEKKEEGMTAKSDTKKEEPAQFEPTTDDQKKKEEESEIHKETSDWVKERAVTLARALQIMGLLWADIPPPPGEESDNPRLRTSSKRSEASKMRKDQRLERKERLLARCIGLFDGLGWANPVLVCQIARNSLNMQGCCFADDSFKEHIGHDIRSRKERKNTMFSINGVSQYLCGILRPKTRSLLLDNEPGEIDHYKYDLTDSGFDLLDESYAFDLILPYAMALISLVDATMMMAGILLIRTFLSRLPDYAFGTYEDVLYLRCSSNVLGREANVLGLALHLVKAIASCDDPRHRQVAHETLKHLLEKCRHPAIRYVIAECMVQESKRMAVTAQLVTDLKDVVRYSDQVAVDGTVSDWGLSQASALRTRFVELCLPRFFTPQKSLLSSVSPMVSVANACLFLAASDERLVSEWAENETACADISRRKRFMKPYCKLGVECVRALASAAEHDQKNVPTSRLAKENRSEAMAVFAASEKALNQGVAAICALNSALQFL